MGVPVLPTLQGVSTGRSESLGDVTEPTTCACPALLGAAEGCCLIWLVVSTAGATPLSSAELLILWECVSVFGRLRLGLVSTGRLSASPPPRLAGRVCSAAWSEETTSALPSSAATSPALSLGACSIFPSAECFPLVAVFLEAAGAAEALEAAPDFGEAFSEDVSVVPLGLGPDLAVTADDCLEGAKEAFTGLAVDLAVDPVVEGGFVIFFLGASLVALSAAEDLEPSLLSSFLGEAVFFTVDPCLETSPKTEENINTEYLAKLESKPDSGQLTMVVWCASSFSVRSCRCRSSRRFLCRASLDFGAFPNI